METGLQIDVSDENLPIVLEFLDELNDRIAARAKARGAESEKELRDLLVEEFLNKPEDVRDREVRASIQRIRRLERRTM